VVLIAVIALAQGREPRRGPASIAGWSFALGIVLFSGSLFALAAGGARWIGWLTPFGGAALTTCRSSAGHGPLDEYGLGPYAPEYRSVAPAQRPEEPRRA
jgi:hypothetical protein